MAFVHRRLWEQKPKPWGPASVVHASMLDNVEKTGIDPVSLYMANPHWGPGKQHDYANKQVGVLSGVTFEKNALAYNRDNDYVAFPRNSKIEPSSGITCLVYGVFDNPGSNSYNQFLAKHKNTWSEPYYSYTFRYSSATKKYECQINVGGVRKEIASDLEYQADYGKYVCVGFSWGDDGYLRLWKNGEVIGSKSIGSGSITYYDTPLYLGYTNSYASGRLAGLLDQTLLFNCQLTSDQIACMTSSPWGIWQPPTFRTYFIPSGDVPIFNIAALNASNPTRIIQ